MISLLKGINNPQAFIQEAIKEKNPMVGEAMQHIQNNNGNAQAAFYNLAAELGVDPNEVLNLLR